MSRIKTIPTHFLHKDLRLLTEQPTTFLLVFDGEQLVQPMSDPATLLVF